VCSSDLAIIEILGCISTTVSVTTGIGVTTATGADALTGGRPNARSYPIHGTRSEYGGCYSRPGIPSKRH